MTKKKDEDKPRRMSQKDERNAMAVVAAFGSVSSIGSAFGKTSSVKSSAKPSDDTTPDNSPAGTVVFKSQSGDVGFNVPAGHSQAAQGTGPHSRPTSPDESKGEE